MRFGHWLYRTGSKWDTNQQGSYSPSTFSPKGLAIIKLKLDFWCAAMTPCDDSDKEALGSSLMTQIRRFHEGFGVCQQWTAVARGKELGRGCTDEVQCRVTAHTAAPFSLYLGWGNLRSSYGPPQTHQGILHSSSGCKPILVWPKYCNFPFYLMTNWFY